MKYKRTPTVLQMEATECGAAALGSILGYYGCFLPLEELRIACGVSRDGSKAVNMLKAARKYGLIANSAQAELDELRTIKPPFIIYWEFNHFLVIDAIKKNKVYINDPATGPRTITWDLLNKGFTGVLLLFEPTDKVLKLPKQQLLLNAFKQPILLNKSALILIAIVSLFLVVPGILLPSFNKIFIDDILIQNMQGWFYPLILGLLLSMVLQGLLIFIQQRVLLKLKVKMVLSLGANLIWHILHLPMQFFYQRYAGDIGDRINANDRIAALLSNEMTASIVAVFSMIFFAIILLIIDVRLGCIGLLNVIINFSILIIISRRIEDKARDVLQQYGRLTGMEMNSLQMIESIKASATEEDFFKRWSGSHAKIIVLEQKIAFLNQLLIVVPQFLYGLNNVAILAVGSWLIMQGQLTIGGLVAFQSLLIQFSAPLNTLLKFGNNIQQIRGDLLRINDVLQYGSEETQIDNCPAEKAEPTELSGEITAENLVFGYSELEKPLISNFNLKINAGQCVAFIGQTGSGKSTLARLFMNLYKPWEGKIKLQDMDLLDLSPEVLANSIAMVEQEFFLFEGSIRDNLSLWDPTVRDETLNESLKTVELYDEILPRGGLNFLLLEGGTNLSGGQRQRLEIARALIKNPKLLILDEATAALDPPLEKKFFTNLKDKKMTIIIVTHRINAIRDCDEIILIAEGKIKHRGTHEQLLTIDLYKKLVQLEED